MKKLQKFILLSILSVGLLMTSLTYISAETDTFVEGNYIDMTFKIVDLDGNEIQGIELIREYDEYVVKSGDSVQINDGWLYFEYNLLEGYEDYMLVKSSLKFTDTGVEMEEDWTQNLQFSTWNDETGTYLGKTAIVTAVFTDKLFAPKLEPARTGQNYIITDDYYYWEDNIETLISVNGKVVDAYEIQYFGMEGQKFQLPMSLKSTDIVEVEVYDNTGKIKKSDKTVLNISKEQYVGKGLPFSMKIVDEKGNPLDHLSFEIYGQLVSNKNNKGWTYNSEYIDSPYLDEDGFLIGIEFTDMGSGKKISLKNYYGIYDTEYFASFTGPLEIVYVFTQILPTPVINTPIVGDTVIVGNLMQNDTEHFNLYLNNVKLPREKMIYDDYWYFEYRLDTPIKNGDVIKAQAIHPTEGKYNSEVFEIIALSEQFKFKMNAPLIGDKIVSGRGIPGTTIKLHIIDELLEGVMLANEQNNSKLYETVVNDNGFWFIELEKEIDKGSTVFVTQMSSEGISMAEDIQLISEVALLNAPKVDEVRDGDVSISGTADSKAMTEVFIELDSGKIYEAKVSEDGTWVIELDAPIHLNDAFIVYGKSKDGMSKTSLHKVILEKAADEIEEPQLPNPDETEKPVVPDKEEKPVEKPTEKPVEKPDDKVVEDSNLEKLPATGAQSLLPISLALIGVGIYLWLKQRKRA